MHMLIDLYCPIELKGYEIFLDEKKDIIYCAVSFYNLSQKNVTSVKYTLYCFDSFGEPVEMPPANIVEALLQDENAVPKNVFGSSKPIPLTKFPNTRDVEIIVNRVKFDDGTIWNNDETGTLRVIIEKIKEPDEIVALTKVAGNDAICYAREEESYWLCVCGRANPVSYHQCIRCKRNKAHVLSCCSDKMIINQEIESLKQKEDRERIEKEQEERKFKENEAREAAKRKEQQAEELRKLQDEQRAKVKIARQKKLKIAKIIVPSILFIIITWLAIVHIILPPIVHSRINENIVSASYSHTVGLRTDGTVVAVGSNSDGQCEVQAWHDIIAISAGGSHTVGLKSDYTVVAVGSNVYERSNVQDWRRIVAISAGGSHTVGLKSNGTVVAVGSNVYGRSNVQDWRRIVAISADGSHTVGLKSNGTAVAVGFNRYGQCEVYNWSDVGPAD